MVALMVSGSAFGQEHYTFGTVLDGDTVPLYYLREVTVYSSGMLLTPREIRQNAKLIKNVRLMRPYAIEGKHRLDKLEVEIAALPRRDRRAASRGWCSSSSSTARPTARPTRSWASSAARCAQASTRP